MTIKRIAISGSNGYLASNFIKYLKKKKIKTLKFSNSIKNRNYYYVNKNYSLLKKYIKKFINVDFFFHFAYLNNQYEAELNYNQYVRKNLKIIKNIIEILPSSVTFVFISSVSVYGSSKKRFSEISALTPLSNYDKCKIICEKFIKKHMNIKKRNYIILRISNVYGYHKYNQFTRRGIIGYLLENILSNNNINLETSGNHLRDYLHISDFVLALFKLTKISNKFNIYNVVSEKSYTLKYIIKLIINLLKKNKKFKYKKEIKYNCGSIQSKTDTRNFLGTCKRFKNNFNWIPKIKIYNSLSEEIKNLKI